MQQQKSEVPFDPGGETVWVRRQWDNQEKAKYRLIDLADVRWDEISGGVCAPAPQPFLHGFVQCDAQLEGRVAHSGGHGRCPHRIKVCIVKKDNDPEVFAYLQAQAGLKPPRKPRGYWRR